MQWNTMIFMHENEIQIHLQDGAFEHLFSDDELKYLWSSLASLVNCIGFVRCQFLS